MPVCALDSKRVTLRVSWNPKQEDAIHLLPVRSASQMSPFWIFSLQLVPFCLSIWWYCGWITSTAWKFVTPCHNPNIAQDAGASNHLRSGFCGMVNCHKRVCVLNGIGIRFSNSEKKQRICIVVKVWAITFKKLINCHNGFQQLVSHRGHFLWRIEWQHKTHVNLITFLSSASMRISRPVMVAPPSWDKLPQPPCFLVYYCPLRELSEWGE